MGYNVIEHLVVNCDEWDTALLKSSLVDICHKKIEPMFVLIYAKVKT